MHAYVRNKCLFLSTQNYDFFYSVWEALNSFGQSWGAAGSRNLRNTAVLHCAVKLTWPK
jgi:hypothetical protein